MRHFTKKQLKHSESNWPEATQPIMGRVGIQSQTVQFQCVLLTTMPCCLSRLPQFIITITLREKWLLSPFYKYGN